MLVEDVAERHQAGHRLRVQKPRRRGVSTSAPDVRRAAELIHDPAGADDAGYHERERGIVDTTSDQLAAALLRAGWTPPTDTEETP
jgi:hypothetical protein